MIGSLIDLMLGEVGRQVLHFYQANSVVINLIVLTYGLVLSMSWTTYIRIYRHIVILLARKIHEHPQVNAKSFPKQIRSQMVIPWDEAVSAAPFPLVARLGDLLPKRRSVENVQALSDETEIITHALDVLNGVPIGKIMPSHRKITQKRVASMKDSRN